MDESNQSQPSSLSSSSSSRTIRRSSTSAAAAISNILNNSNSNTYNNRTTGLGLKVLTEDSPISKQVIGIPYLSSKKLTQQKQQQQQQQSSSLNFQLPQTSPNSSPSSLISPSKTNPNHPNEMIYTVIIRGRPFKLTYDQITYDQPNLFTTSFLGSFYESRSNVLKIMERSIENFELIYEYLSGYAILPLKESLKDKIDLRNLLSDCEYYGLMRLRDELTLPRVNESLSSRYRIERCIRFEDLIFSKNSSGTSTGHHHSTLNVGSEFKWIEDGLVEVDPINRNSSGPVHVLVYLTKVTFKLDLTVRSNGECPNASFAIELPSYSINYLRDKPLKLKETKNNSSGSGGGVSGSGNESKENGLELVTVMGESLSSTPLNLDDEFDGNFGDLVNWIASFLARFNNSNSSSGLGNSISTNKLQFTVQEEMRNETLSKIMPALAENLKLRSSQGQTSLKLSTSFWSPSMSIIIASENSSSSSSPLTSSIPSNLSKSTFNSFKNFNNNNNSSNSSNNNNSLVAKVINCNLTTGLYRRKNTRPLVIL